MSVGSVVSGFILTGLGTMLCLCFQGRAEATVPEEQRTRCCQASLAGNKSSWCGKKNDLWKADKNARRLWTVDLRLGGYSVDAALLLTPRAGVPPQRAQPA